MAQDAFQEAIELDSDYARAYNGLAGTLFQIARPSIETWDDCLWEWDTLAEAYSSFEKALQAPDKPVAGDVDYRARQGMGRIRFFQGLCLDEEDWDTADRPWYEAEDDLNFVVTEYQANPHPQRALPAAFAFTDLGHMYYEQACSEFMAGAGSASDSEIRNYLDGAIRSYEGAIEIAGQVNSHEGDFQAESVKPYLDAVRRLKVSDQPQDWQDLCRSDPPA